MKTLLMYKLNPNWNYVLYLLMKSQLDLKNAYHQTGTNINRRFSLRC